MYQHQGEMIVQIRQPFILNRWQEVQRLETIETLFAQLCRIGNIDESTLGRVLFEKLKDSDRRLWKIDLFIVIFQQQGKAHLLLVVSVQPVRDIGPALTHPITQEKFMEMNPDLEVWIYVNADRKAHGKRINQPCERIDNLAVSPAPEPGSITADLPIWVSPVPDWEVSVFRGELHEC